MATLNRSHSQSMPLLTEMRRAHAVGPESAAQEVRLAAERSSARVSRQQAIPAPVDPAERWPWDSEWPAGEISSPDGPPEAEEAA